MANAVSFGQRRGMGQKYSVDPALVLERKRIEEEYANAPIAESRRRFNEQLAFEKDKAADANRGSMIGTAIQAPMSYYALKQMGVFGNGTPAVAAPATSAAVTPATTTGTIAAPTGGVSGGTALTGGAGTESALTGSTPTYSLGTPAISAPMEGAAAAEGSTGAVGSGAGVMGTYGSTALASFGAGYTLGGTVGQPIGEMVGIGDKKINATAGGAGIGATVGAGIGSIVPGVGTAIGAGIGTVLGSIGGYISEACIIVTACTNRHSYEVEIAREYRDAFMDADQLRGYYALAEQIVPRIEDSDRLRKFFKKYLVNRLVDYGEYKLGKKDRKPEVMSCIVSKGFLGACKMIGKILPIYIRANGEVY